MKKIVTLAMAFSLVFALSACGQKEAATAPTNAGSTQSTGTPAATSGSAQEVKLVATNFQFDQKEYHVKKGSEVKVTLENKEGLHGINIGEFKVQLDNSKKTATFTPDKAGSYDIICSVPCGQGHMNMKAKLIVD